MITFNWYDFQPALAEMFLAAWAMFLLMVGVFSKPEKAAAKVGTFSILGFAITFCLLLSTWKPGLLQYAMPRINGEWSSGMYVLDDFAGFMKSLILLGAALAVLLAGDFLQKSKLARFEYYVLITLSVLGMMVMASAHDLLALYVGLELMSFSLYILCAFARKQDKSAEAGLKYFVLGSLSSGLLLFGLSLFYGMTGGTSFALVHNVFAGGIHGEQFVMASVALVLVMVGLAFKISAVPFHMWTPDVYEGAPTPVTAFMAVTPKIAAFALFIRVLAEPLGGIMFHWQQILVVLAIPTMAVGAYAAIMQSNLKRLLAYSSIGHVGFMLVGLASGTVEGVQGVLFYLVTYIFMTTGAFAVLLMLHKRGIFAEKIEDLSGLSQRAPALALAMLIFMFSLAGVPPLAGFFAKFHVFMAAVSAGLVWLAVLAVLFSVVAAYYCLRVVKVMYFDEVRSSFDVSGNTAVRNVVWLMALATLGFGIFPGLITQAARAAALSLF